MATRKATTRPATGRAKQQRRRRAPRAPEPGSAICRRLCVVPPEARGPLAAEAFYGLLQECVERVSAGEAEAENVELTQRLVGIHSAWDGHEHTDIVFNATGWIQLRPMTVSGVATICSDRLQQIDPNFALD